MGAASGAADAVHPFGRSDRVPDEDRLSFLRFVALALEDRVPDAKTLWLFREQLTRAGAIEGLFRRFDAVLRDAGYLAMGGQIVDASVIQVRRPWPTRRRSKVAAYPRAGRRRSGHRWISRPLEAQAWLQAIG
jgi:hypothetical protein